MTLNLQNAIFTLGMIGSRVTGMVIFAPLFGHSALPARIKAALVVAMVAVLFPLVPVQATSTSPSLLCLFSEMTIGMIIGVVVTLVFDGAQLAGQVAGTQFGFSLVNIIDPQTQVDTPVLSVFHQLIAMLIFLQLNAHHWILRGLAHSYDYLPLGSSVPRASVFELWKSCEVVWFVGIQIAAPILIATLFTDVTLGFLSKASPQFPALLFGISVKFVIGLLVLSVAIYYWPAIFEHRFSAAINAAERCLRLTR